MLTSNNKAQIIEFAKNKPIEVVYIFGSHATGEVKPLSDYDFAVLFDEAISSHERFDLKLELIAFLSKLLKTDKVDVVDLSTAPPAFRYSAILPRKDLYTKSEAIRIDFEHKALQEFFDRLYYIKRQTAQGLKRFAEQGFKSP